MRGEERRLRVVNVSDGNLWTQTSCFIRTGRSGGHFLLDFGGQANGVRVLMVALA